MRKEQAAQFLLDYLVECLHHWNKVGGVTYNGVWVNEGHVRKFVRSILWRPAPTTPEHALAAKVFPFCGIFDGKPDKGGYRRFYFDGRSIRAHRFKALVEEGELPDDSEVGHDCDNAGCVMHTTVVTHEENMQHQKDRGRRASKMTVKQRRDLIRITQLFTPTEAQTLLRKQHKLKLSTRQIARMRDGKAWPDEWEDIMASMTPVSIQFAQALGTWEQEHNMEANTDAQPLARAVRRGLRAPNTKLTAEQVTGLRQEFRSGEFSLAKLANKYHLYRATVTQILLGKTYAELPGALTLDEYAAALREVRYRRERR